MHGLHKFSLLIFFLRSVVQSYSVNEQSLATSTSTDRGDGVVVRASASQSVDLGFIP